MTMVVVLDKADALATVVSEHVLDRALRELIDRGHVMAGFDEAGRLTYELTPDGWAMAWCRSAGAA